MAVADLTIVADEHIPFAAEAFGTLGEVRLRHGRQIARADLLGADMLMVRAITRVDRALLEGTGVRFVATATAGIDHVSVDDLDRMGIAFYAARGCNATAVAEYMVAAWLASARRTGVTLRGTRVGIVGVGQVGSRVAARARALGMEPVLNDPPRARAEGPAGFEPLDALLACDIVTCHTPLTRSGPDATWRLMGESWFARMRPGAWFCNTGRGEVVDEHALRQAARDGRAPVVILDVWDHEPRIDPATMAAAAIATPHIAGYSLDGKIAGTRMVYEAACAFAGRTPSWDAAAAHPPAAVPLIEVDARGRPDEHVLDDIVSRVYPIERDDRAMRRLGAMPQDERGREFDRLRRGYPERREFRRTTIRLSGAPSSLAATLQALEFAVAID